MEPDFTATKGKNKIKKDGRVPVKLINKVNCSKVDLFELILLLFSLESF